MRVITWLRQEQRRMPRLGVLQPVQASEIIFLESRNQADMTRRNHARGGDGSQSSDGKRFKRDRDEN